MNNFEYKDFKLKDIASFEYGKMPLKTKLLENGYPVYSGYRIVGYYPEFMYEREKLLIIARGVGGTGDVRISPPRSYVTNLSIIFNENEEIVDYKYLYYYLSNMNMRSLDTGSCQSQITINQLEEYKVRLPEKSIQQKISNILTTIERKIEFNNRINAELEAMSKTLYDYWFVQFDFPNEYGKPYKSSGGKMVWSEALKREVPEGWEVGELKDIANITMGQSPPGESYNESGKGTIFFQGCTDFGGRFPTVRKFTTHPTRYAKDGDILLSVRAPVGTLNVAKESCCIGRGLAALNSRDNCIAYLFGVMTNFKQVFDRRNVDGTTFGSITKDDLFSLKVVKPDKKTLKLYQKITNPVFEKQNKIELENIQLAELRDWLLPMLMNGQVMVGEAIENLSIAAEPKVEYIKK